MQHNYIGRANVEQILDEFKNYMIKSQKSQNTIKSYMLHIKEYMIWFQETYGKGFEKLYRENILDYKSYLINVKKYRGKNLNAKTINAKLSSLGAFNNFLVEEEIQTEIVIKDVDMIKYRQAMLTLQRLAN